MRSGQRFDLAVVGAGIVGLAHAADALDRGLRTVVLERDERAVGASIRNFGHICVTAQLGRALEYGWTARERWIQVGEKVGFAVERSGTVVVARTALELAVLEEFAAARGSEQVVLLTAAEVRGRLPFATDEVLGGAHLPLDLRVNPEEVLTELAGWLVDSGVDIRFGTNVGELGSGTLHTTHGHILADRIVHAPGHNVDRLFPDIAESVQLRRCKLHMLGVAPPSPAPIQPGVLTGQALLRYQGLATMPSAGDVMRDFEDRYPELLAIEMNLMCTQRPDGTVVLGDTHQYARTHSPFDDEHITELLLREGTRLFAAPLTIRRRWCGVYAHSTVTDFLIAAPEPDVRVVSVTSGIGMTTAFGLAPVVLDQLL